MSTHEAQEIHEPLAEPEASAEAPQGGDAEAGEQEDPAARAQNERKRIEEQLAQLERKQAELRRALASAEHPELADAIREIEGRAYGVARAEERLANPLTKAEERQRAKLEAKLEAAKAKRAELDATIASLESELAALTDARLEGLRAQHEEALKALFAAMARHADAFEAAGLQMTTLVPELEKWLPELRAMAEKRVTAQA